jgi:hypothetical protein
MARAKSMKVPVEITWSSEDLARIQRSFELVAEAFRKLANDCQSIAGALEYIKDRAEQDASH